MGLVTLGGACVLSLAETAIEPTDTGWSETLNLEVLAEGACPHVDLHLPPGVTLDKLKARVRLSDGTRHKLDEVRQRRAGGRPGCRRLRLRRRVVDNAVDDDSVVRVVDNSTLDSTY